MAEGSPEEEKKRGEKANRRIDNRSRRMQVSGYKKRGGKEKGKKMAFLPPPSLMYLSSLKTTKKD